MENSPTYISLIFLFTTFLTVYFFYKVANNSKPVLAVMSAWLILQALIAYTGFYSFTATNPPRFVLLVLPPVVFISILFLSAKGRAFIDSLEIKKLALLHIIRVPVEIVLLLLFLYKAVPRMMTFEGRNFDILSGLTAPLIYYFGFFKKRSSKKIILAWNFICLALLINIVVIAVLSAPFSFQKFAFDQPNVAILYFPFVLLPAVIVPIVLFAHLVAIRQILVRKTKTNEEVFHQKLKYKLHSS